MDLGMIEFVEVVLAACKMYPTRTGFLGIDPGASGAVAFVIARQATVTSIPIVKIKRKGGSKTEFDYSAVAAGFRRLWPIRHSIQAGIEQALVQTVGKASAYNGFRVGVSFSVWPAILSMLNVSYEVIHPLTWKVAMKLRGKDKEASRSMARTMFPSAAYLLERKKDEGRAEALLIAEYQRRRFAGKL